MARALTAPELALLRSDMQGTKLYLAVYQPNTVYTALLNGIPTSNDGVSVITFDGGTGTLGDVKPGMTLYVGTSAGAFDLGMCRIRKDPIAGTFYIGLISEIVWADNCYLTVVDDFDLWAKHAAIVDSALVMDAETAYSDQHTDFNPVPMLGSHAVAWLDAATVDVDFDASDSWVFDSTISAYAWTAPGSSASNGMATATPTITYDTPGCYRVFCTVTAANGKTTTGVRHVFVYDRDANQPFTVFQLAQAVADYDTGGWMFDMTMEAEASLSEIRERSLVVLFAEDWYGTTKQSIGPIEGRENIVCVGRIVGESILWDRETGLVHFTVQGPHYWLNKIKAFPVELTFATNTPDSWSVIPDMTVDRVLWHILYWHSTAIETMDFYPSNDTKFLPDGKSLASMIWGQLGDIAQSRLLASPGVDRFGRLFIEIDPQMVPEVDRTWATVMELTDVDWQEGIDLQRVIVEDVSLITLSSQQVDASGSVSTLYSLSPGHVPLRYGEPLGMDRLLAASQTESNSLAGLALGWHTNEFPDVPVILAQNNRMIDLFPRQFCALAVTSIDTPREIAFDGNLIPRRIALYFDNVIGYMHPELNFEAETFEQVNTDGDIPDVDDTSIPAFPGFGSFPELPDLDPIYPFDPSSQPNGPPVIIACDNNYGLLYTINGDVDDPGKVQWKFGNAGITSAKVSLIGDVRVTPNGSVWVSIREPNFGGRWFDALWYAPSIGAKFTEVVSKDYLESLFGTGGNGGQIHAWGINPNKPEEVAFLGHNVTGNFMLGNHSGFTQKVAYDPLSELGQLTYGVNQWTFNRNGGAGFIVVFSADGSSVISSTATHPTDWSNGPPDGQIRAGTSGTIFFVYNSSNGLARFTDGDPSTIDIIDTVNPISTHCAVSHDGNNLMGSWNPLSGHRGRSSDSGYTWSGIPNLAFGGDYAYCYCGGVGSESRWLAANGVVRYSPDFGETWLNREGNINHLVPGGLNIIKILVPGI